MSELQRLHQEGMNKACLLRSLQRYIANIGITGSSLRKQGAKGVVAAAREFLANIDLFPLKALLPSDYPAWLDANTESLRQHFPGKAQKWGAARKAMNIFTTQIFLNGEMSAAYGFARFADVMETPLDSVATGELRKMPGGEQLPPWKSVGGLTREVNRQYQEFARNIARMNGIPRACLDVILWRPWLVERIECVATGRTRNRYR